MALEWPDLDLKDGGITVSRSLKGRGEAVGSTKGDRARRVEIGPRLVRVLRDHRARERERREGPLVFTRRDGVSYLDRTYVANGWHKDAIESAEVERSVRLHDLRHTYAASVLAAGQPLVFVQKQLGHSDISTTQKWYGHLERGYLRAAAAETEAAVWSVTKT